MKTLSVVLLLMASMAFVLLGCSDNSAPSVAPTSTSGNTAPPLMKTSGFGAWIFKYDQSSYVWWFLDQNTGLLLVLAMSDMEKFCAHEGGYAVVKIKDIYLPDADPDLRRVAEQMKAADVPASVWQVVVDPTGNTTLRQYICGKDPIFVGTANFRGTDNDIYAWVQDNKNSDAFGYKANGTLQGPDGQEFMLNLVYRFVWDPGTTRYNEVFNLQLTPTGK